jgi:Actinobacteria/chloroflexi VLRF1 release factor
VEEASRVVEVAPARLERWLAGFEERHGSASVVRRGDVVVHILGTDGAQASLDYFAHDPLGLVLVRRGGYAVGLVSDGGLTAAKVGTRHVQSRTAAGGWSQQRFARRRANQADALVEAVATHTLYILLASGQAPRGLVVGGDRTLVAQVLSHPRLRALDGLPRRELFDLPDPTRAVLDRAVERGRAVRVHLTDPT